MSYKSKCEKKITYKNSRDSKSKLGLRTIQIYEQNNKAEQSDQVKQKYTYKNHSYDANLLIPDSLDLKIKTVAVNGTT